ncbi:MAG: hypothetical protein V8S87_05655 [Oscillospiraceae bacterium]
MDVEERPQQYERREQTEEQRDDPRARRVIVRFSGAGAALTGARIGIGSSPDARLRSDPGSAER